MNTHEQRPGFGWIGISLAIVAAGCLLDKGVYFGRTVEVQQRDDGHPVYSANCRYLSFSGTRKIGAGWSDDKSEAEGRRCSALAPDQIGPRSPQ